MQVWQRRCYFTLMMSTKKVRLTTSVRTLSSSSSSSPSFSSVAIVRDLQELKERMIAVHSSSSSSSSSQPFLVPRKVKEEQQDRNKQTSQTANAATTAAGGAAASDSVSATVSTVLTSSSSKEGYDRLLSLFDECEPTTTTVRVEIGQNYMDAETADIPLTSFAQYLRLLEEEAEEPLALPTVYLAQQDMTTIVPELKNHPLPISIQCLLEPFDRGSDLCSDPCSDRGRGLPIYPIDVYSRVLWIGGGRTLSPFHVDPHYNIFEQHRGSKQFRLISAVESKKLKRSSSALQQNTMDVDASLKGVNVVSVVVKEGEELFVPMKWMHEVKPVCVLDESESESERKNVCVSTTTWWRPRVVS